jgi:dihydroxyacetone kinase-like protein
MGPEVMSRLIDAAASAIGENAAELTALDQAIGDGDHGINMQRGFAAIVESRGEISGLALPEALQKIGMTLVMKVGGASGPLYGTLFMAMGKAMPGAPAGAADLAAALQAGVNGVKQRGKSEAGEKTMLDVLVPVSQAFESAAAEGASLDMLLAQVQEAADKGLDATRDMLATKGRASFLGERSIGHLDPGARSSQILVTCVCDTVGALAASEAEPA